MQKHLKISQKKNKKSTKQKLNTSKRDKQIERERGEREARKREIEQEKENQVPAPNTGRENH